MNGCVRPLNPNFPFNFICSRPRFVPFSLFNLLSTLRLHPLRRCITWKLAFMRPAPCYWICWSCGLFSTGKEFISAIDRMEELLHPPSYYMSLIGFQLCSALGTQIIFEFKIWTLLSLVDVIIRTVESRIFHKLHLRRIDIILFFHQCL